MIITANRVIHCNSDTPEEMHHWISLLQKPKGDARIDGQEFLVRGENVYLGWLHVFSSVHVCVKYQGIIMKCVFLSKDIKYNVLK